MSVGYAEEIKALHDELAQLRRHLETARSSASTDTRRRILEKVALDKARMKESVIGFPVVVADRMLAIFDAFSELVKQDGPT